MRIIVDKDIRVYKKFWRIFIFLKIRINLVLTAHYIVKENFENFNQLYLFSNTVNL